MALTCTQAAYGEPTSSTSLRRPKKDRSFGNLMMYPVEPFPREQRIGLDNRLLSVGAINGTKTGRLHRAASNIVLQQMWTSEVYEMPSYSPDIYSSQSKEISGVVAFNPKMFKARHLKQGFLTTRIKQSLKKPHWERDKIDLERIRTLIDKTKAFEKYPPNVKKSLARVVTYNVFENGETILHEDQFGLSLNYIVSGTVTIEVSHKDKISGRLIKQVLHEKMAGESFGERFIVHEGHKIAAVACREITEILKIEKDDIEEALKKSYRLETERRMNFLKSLDLFDRWLQNDIRLLNTSSKTIEYAPNKVIIKDMREKQDCSLFIMSGQCQVVREVPVISERLPFGREKVSLAAVDENDNVKKNQRIDRRFETLKNLNLVISVLKEGDFFCVDEDIGKSCVLSVTKTELLSVPKYSLLAQQRGAFYDYLRSIAMKRYPDKMQTFQKYMRGRNWNLYKKGLMDEIANRRSKSRLSASLHDVPKCLQEA